jgi:hypothetical protein
MMDTGVKQLGRLGKKWKKKNSLVSLSQNNIYLCISKPKPALISPPIPIFIPIPIPMVSAPPAPPTGCKLAGISKSLIFLSSLRMVA